MQKRKSGTPPLLKKSKAMTSKELSLQYAQNFVDFVNESPTPYHAVNSVKELLKSAGFEELVERNNWRGRIQKNGKYYVTRNGSSIIAFTVGGKYKNGNGIAIVGAHTDSPCLRIKPISKKNLRRVHYRGGRAIRRIDCPHLV